MAFGPMVTLKDVESLPDPLHSHTYNLFFPNIPGDGKDEQSRSKDTSLVTRRLSIQCQTVAAPGKTVEDTPVELHGHTSHFAGKATFSGTMSITFVETRTLVVYNALRKWQSVARDHRDQLGGYKEDYAVRAELDVFDNKGIHLITHEIKGVWLQELPDIEFNQDANIVTHAATFTYDYWDPSYMDGRTSNVTGKSLLEQEQVTAPTGDRTARTTANY